jgi:hypothetical protein
MLSTGSEMIKERRISSFVYLHEAKLQQREAAMRATGFLITASIFSSVFLASAFITLQTRLGARPALRVRMQN